MLKKINWLAVALVLVGLGGGPAAAQEEARTLKERIKSVSSKLHAKSGRLELTLLPMTSMSLNDAFYQKFGGGLGLTYHFSESWSAGLLATYSLNLQTSNAAYFGRKEISVPYAGMRNFLVGLDLAWAPLYGKVSLAAEWVMHFDTYLIAGVAGIGGEQVGDELSFGFAASFGLGVRLFLSRMFAIRVELKDYMVFNDTVTFQSQEKGDFQHQLMLNLGLSMFLLEGDVEDDK
jgi:outer membrane beta-barrel protein